MGSGRRSGGNDRKRSRRTSLVALLLGWALVAVGLASPAYAADPPITALHDCGGNLTVLPGNDDGSTGSVPLGFTFNFFGTQATQLFVNNNGNVTFNSALGTFTPSAITGNTGRPIIAPFFADVDTRAGNVVRYGQTTFGGRPAFCVDWRNVGYYAVHTDKLNTFQLLIVDRSDVRAGDADVYFNYDQVQWETGDASGGRGGLGGVSALAGFASGSGNDNTEFTFPGSLVPGGLLDDNAVTGLDNFGTNSVIEGRHIFSIRNGVTAVDGRVEGLVTDTASPPTPLAGAPVQLCRVSDERCIFFTATGDTGRFIMSGVPDGSYRLTAFPPAGSNLVRMTSPPFDVVNGATVIRNLALTAPIAPPPDIRIVGSTTAGTVPVVIVNRPFIIRRTGCDGGAGSVRFTRPGSATTIFGPVGLIENPPGTYQQSITLPFTGEVVAIVTVAGCPEQSFTIYIDPSGFVRTVSGAPIVGAQVVLSRGDTAAGPFTQVPNGDAIMSPANRTNPDVTDSTGHFGWDTIAGFYRVRASAPGCHAPGNPSQAFVETAVLEVPPPVTDIDLRLDCPSAVISSTDLPAVVRSSTEWLLRDSLTTGIATAQFSYGARPQAVLFGDWDGDGTATPGTFSAGVFKLRTTNAAGAADITFTFGDSRGFPVAGDFDGDGIDTVGVFRNGTWQLTNVNAAGPATVVSFGSGVWPATVPVVGDWNGDGRDSLGTWSAGTWALRNSTTSGAADLTFSYGPASSTYPVVGDWNGDGVDTVGVRGPGSTWELRNSNSAGAADLAFGYGEPGDLPLVWKKP
ncbi:MAG: nidogen-like domain-containing protein [Pseudonocardiaceae bacterium]